MKGRFVSFIGAIVAVALLAAGCGQAAPAPTPTKAPAVPTKVAEPTRASAAPTKAPEPTKPAAAPTAAPAKKADFPEKGKTITWIVPWDAGGNADVATRLLATAMEKDLGVPIQIVNRAGAGSQLGLTELARSKADGYTIGTTTAPSSSLTYLNPERKPAFGRKDFAPLGNISFTPTSFAVRSDSPYKTVKDLVDGAKAKPETIKMSTTGAMDVNHIQLLLFQKLAGVRFVPVHFAGGAAPMTALLGGHVDAGIGAANNYLSALKSGDVRLLGIMAQQESKFYPGVKTMESQGFKMYSGSWVGFSAPAGTPKEAVEVLSAAIKKALDTDELKKKMDEMSYLLQYMDASQWSAFWDDIDSQMKPVIEEALREQK